MHQQWRQSRPNDGGGDSCSAASWAEGSGRGIGDAIMPGRWPSNTRAAQAAPLVDIERRSRAIARCNLHAGRDATLQRARSTGKNRKAVRMACHAMSARRACQQAMPAGTVNIGRRERPQHATSATDVPIRGRLAVEQHAIRPGADHAAVIPNVRVAERGTCCHGVAPSSGPFPGDARVRNYGFSGPAILGRRYRITPGISETFLSDAAPSIPCATPCLPMR